MSVLPDKKGHVRIEDGMVAIFVPFDEIQSLLVALQPCPCKGAKSRATADVRKRLADALSWARARI